MFVFPHVEAGEEVAVALKANAADGAVDVAATDGAAVAGAADAGGAADGDAVAPPHAAAITAIAARTAGNRAFIGLLLSRLPCTGNASASCNPTAPVSTYYSSNEQGPGMLRPPSAGSGKSGGIA